ncbi:hypothetical protein H0Z11_10655 [Pantoea agglomerans]|uniref:hypothetical protein n=1 Tax=Enterobacter agglomerans TaxID=549 RepID=UPI001AA05077|nr:hypothetical protein [Pantoea agglomerans]QTC52254.1 hypothetical protein H0Z11_10655 [Pantoea agglomerans]
MQYSNQVIGFLQENDILAKQLDHALLDVKDAVSNQINTIGAGARRALYYTSCFTDEYNDVCQKQKTEDIRFAKGIYHILRHEDIVYEMLSIYFKEAFRNKTHEQLEHIKRLLMEVNIHIAASSLTNYGFVLATAAAVSFGLNINLDMAALTGRISGGVIVLSGFYGVAQNAADSAHRLNIQCPTYYGALYAQELEMMYFLIEPLFKRAEAFQQSTSEENIANIITRMIG